jgi:hypothetical protein
MPHPAFYVAPMPKQFSEREFEVIIEAVPRFVA